MYSLIRQCYRGKVKLPNEQIVGSQESAKAELILIPLPSVHAVFKFIPKYLTEILHLYPCPFQLLAEFAMEFRSDKDYRGEYNKHNTVIAGQVANKINY